MKAWARYALCVAVGCLAGAVAVSVIRGKADGGDVSNVEAVASRDGDAVTVVRHDTVYVSLPLPDPVRDTVIVYRAEPFPERLVITDRDTVRVSDTVYVEVPFSRVEYKGDAYDLWISGYKPRIDSLMIVGRSETVTVKEKARRWGLGVMAGYGVAKEGLSPYVGVGMYYRIW